MNNNQNNNDRNRIKFSDEGLAVIIISLGISIILGCIIYGVHISKKGYLNGYWIFGKGFCEAAPGIFFVIGIVLAIIVFAMIIIFEKKFENFANKNKVGFLINYNIIITLLYGIVAIILLIAYILAIPSLIREVNNFYLDGSITKEIFSYIGIGLILPFYNLIGGFETSIPLLNVLFYVSIFLGFISSIKIYLNGTVLTENDFCSYLKVTYNPDTGIIYDTHYVSADDRAFYWNCVIFFGIIVAFTFVPIVSLIVILILQIKNLLNIFNIIRRIRGNN